MSTGEEESVFVIDHHKISEHPRALLDVLDGRRPALIVRDVLSPRFCASLVEDFSSGRLDVPSYEMKDYAGRCFGPTVVVWSGPLDGYFSAAERTTRALEKRGDPFAAVARVLTALGAGQRVGAAQSRTGRSAATLNAREIRPGGMINPHCENETRSFPTMRWITEGVGRRTILSFYVPLALPDAGGELQILPFQHGSPSGEPLLRIGRTGPAMERLLESSRPLVPRTGVGDLLVFDSGSRYHRVTPVGGTRPRWTMGGFIGVTPDDRDLVLWT